MLLFLPARLKLGALFNMDLCSVLNGQPLQMMCKNVQVRGPVGGAAERAGQQAWGECKRQQPALSRGGALLLDSALVHLSTSQKTAAAGA